MLRIKIWFKKLGYKIRRGWRRCAGAWANAWARITRREKVEDTELFADTRSAPVLDENGEFMDEDSTRLFAPVRDEQMNLQERNNKGKEEEPEQLFVARNRPRPFVLSVLFCVVKLTLLIVVLLGFAGLGGVIGIAKAYVDTTPTLDRAQLTKSDRTSYLYDMNGDLITSIADLEYRDWVDIEDVPEMLKNAFVAVEDVRFYRHNGVDIKRLMKAAIEVLGNSNSSGGSTITQQLIKNKILTSERNYKRKIQEAYLALELEQEISKDDILEAYLNDIHLGGSNYGVKTAAKDYFGKELSQLTIRECALLAGITRFPSRYNPRTNRYSEDESKWQNTVKRTNTVLEAMYENGFITLEQYEEALEEEVHIVKESQQSRMYDMPHFVEYAIRDVVTHLLAQRNLPDTNANRSMVENELRTGGYHIYTTVDPAIQNTVQETLENWEEYPTLANPDAAVKTETLSNGAQIVTVQPQASAVVLDYHTGELRAVVGSRETPTIRKSLNRAYQSYMEVGSAIKPIAIYGPALDAGASPASVIANLPAAIDGWGTDKGYPAIGNKERIGPVTLRRGVMSSLNVVAARTLFEYISPEVAAQYLVNMGAERSEINADGPGLALGTSGLTTIQMAAAYGTIAGGGEYKEPLSFSKVVDDDGNVVLDAEAVRIRHQVFKPSTAWLLADILEDAVQSGTGTRAKISGMTVAGKTGTNANYKSVYFAGMTPYYTATVWIGHDNPQYVLKKGAEGGRYAAPVWQAFMSKIHEGLADKDIMETTPEELGLVKKTVCSVSGLLATDACKADTDGHTPVSDWFLAENAPTEYCDMHAAVTLCSVTGQIATENCPESYMVSGSQVLIRPGSYYDQFTDEELAAGFTNAVRTALTVEEYMQWAAGGANVCQLHGWYQGGSLSGFQVQKQAENMINTLEDWLSRDLTEEDRERLEQDLENLEEQIEQGVSQKIYAAINQAEYDLSYLEDRYDEAAG